MDERDRRLNEPHVAPLMELVLSLRSRGFNTPNIDPNDGGVNARALFLLESPGPRAVGTGYISQDNPDQSARNMRGALHNAGLDRQGILLWNVVPYNVSSVLKNRNASSKQILDAIPETQAFLDRIPKLKAIVFGGRKAALAKAKLQLPASVSAFVTFHPGAQSYNHERCRLHIAQTFQAVQTVVST